MPASSPSSPLWTQQTWIYLGFIILLSFFTYFYRYDYPQAVYWDENYHIASAQKYLNGIYFMEPHPPLGKLLIAAGEKLFHSNTAANDKLFIGTDYGSNFPAGFSFTGYRFFPALLAWLTAPVFFLIFLLIFRDGLQASLMSFLYVFDNALIVHLRGAMLESTLLFFTMLLCLAFLLLLEDHVQRKHLVEVSILFGVALGCALTTKVTALVMILLVPGLLYWMYPNWRMIQRFFVPALLSCLLVYCGVWYLHFSIGRTVNPALPDNGYYQATTAFKNILNTHQTRSLAAFPVMLRDSWHFVTHYENGAPRLDLAKPDENGSPWFFWPLGGRTINYRWETADGRAYRYLYLVPNPVVWFLGLFGVFAVMGLLLSSVVNPSAERLRSPFLKIIFLSLYIGYLVGVARIQRVMYLYHYFTPLLFSFVLLALFIINIRRIGKYTVTHEGRTIGLMVMAALVCVGYQLYRPFTYYEPITKEQVERRNLLPIWELTPIGDQKKSMLVVPRAAAQ